MHFPNIHINILMVGIVWNNNKGGEYIDEDTYHRAF
jgi:hypothetical protein